MSHLVLCTKGVHTTRQLSCIPIVKVLLKLYGNTGLNIYIHAKMHRIKVYKTELECTIKELAFSDIQ